MEVWISCWRDQYAVYLLEVRLQLITWIYCRHVFSCGGTSSQENQSTKVHVLLRKNAPDHSLATPSSDPRSGGSVDFKQEISSRTSAEIAGALKEGLRGTLDCWDITRINLIEKPEITMENLDLTYFFKKKKKHHLPIQNWDLSINF